MNENFLLLENGDVFKGHAPSALKKEYFGEAVFTTGMCGYYESLTDPSFSKQILVFTYPLIGNYGVPASHHFESKKVHAAGVIVSTACENWSHHQGLLSLQDWLKEFDVPLLFGVDTRALTKVLREKGSMRAIISSESKSPASFEEVNDYLVPEVSIKKKQIYGKGKKRVIAVDCGMKESMVRNLEKFDLEVVRVPYDYDYSGEEFDGVFLSNGPGNPEKCVETLAVLRKAMLRKKPIFGVCLGSQLLALAAGAKTYKLRYGHRGQNQPCMEQETKKCFITSQNHGYAVDEATLPSDWKVTFKNLNDGSVEGIAHKSLPFYSVQFHPEACPGPTDTRWFFEKFYSCLIQS